MAIGWNVDRRVYKRSVITGLFIMGAMVFILLITWARHTDSYFTYANTAETIVLYIGAPEGFESREVQEAQEASENQEVPGSQGVQDTGEDTVAQDEQETL